VTLLLVLLAVPSVQAGIADYAFEGTLLKLGAPAQGDTVRIYDFAVNPTDSLYLFTDAQGIYRHVPVSSVPMAPPAFQLSAYPNPDPFRFDLYVPVSDKRPLAGFHLRFYDLRGRDVSRGVVAAGTYLAVLRHEGQALATTKVLFSDGQNELTAMALRVQPIAQGEKVRAPGNPMDVVIKYASPGCQTQTLETALMPEGTTLPTIDLEEETLGIITAHGRTGDEVGNLLSNGGAWRFVNSSSGEEYLAALDAQGYWEVSLPDTIPLDRQFYVSFTGNADVREGTFTFMKSDESSATGVEFTNVDVHDGQESQGLATLDQITYDAGHVALTFRTASAENDTIIAMIRNPYTNQGVASFNSPIKNLINRLDAYPSMDCVGDERKAQHEQTLNFVASVDQLPGIIAHPYSEQISEIQEVYGENHPLQGAVVIFQDNTSGPGNIRGPPPGHPTFYFAVGHTRESDPQSLQITEVMEALGINDYSTGNNWRAFVTDDLNQILGLSHIGKAVLAVANTYLPGDFAIPNQPQVLTTEEFSELTPQEKNMTTSAKSKKTKNLLHK
jgi:hypothetical protein